jgi:predicted transcriptional regulator of viral defense system
MSRPEDIFRAAGGHLRMSEAIEKGISRYMLYKMRDEGTIEQLSRGVYRLAELPAIGNPDLVTVSLRIPNAVICLVSALAVHGLTTQIPHAVDIALPRTTRTPSLDYPVTRVYRFSQKTWSTGIEIQMMDAVPVRVYCVEKTLADCFRYRNKLGMDIVLEALKLYARRNDVHYDKILEYARAHRSDKAMYPYLEVVAK